MRVRGQQSWSIRIDSPSVLADQALWVRGVERIDAPAGGVVPGPLDEDDLPAPTPRTPDPGLPAAWSRWWTAIAGGVTVDARPDLDVLADEPGLSRLVDARFDEFRAWHDRRKERAARRWHERLEQAGTRRRRAGSLSDPLRETHLVADLERRLGRPAPPFVLELLVLPVRDDVIREVRPDRYLVPERVYDSPDWPARLEPLVLRWLA
ncbi:MAG: hypothetical protein BGO37_07605 [Cellulomonas sp. 73-92]|uniref:hypothetical protein n=1 Tax=Cellulomonas sp. 73-92 TaxID=1895740 RepID=UPI00092BDA88|nr:hypothetical protein [Cellulomonas sp. 73-92]OJV78567.1 MAG: hypothetical protein BGO37_07605 [Cellulomonas sp. 73-92]